MPNAPVPAAAEGVSKTIPELIDQRNASVAKSLGAIETEICDLYHMAAILADMLDEQLSPEDETDGVMRILMSKDQLDTLSFAWNDVVTRSRRLRSSFYEANAQ